MATVEEIRAQAAQVLAQAKAAVKPTPTDGVAKNPNAKHYLGGPSASQIDAEKQAILTTLSTGGYGADKATAMAKAMAELKIVENKQQTSRVYLQVALNGAVNVGGMRNFPFNLFPNEMQVVIDHADEIRDWMVANKAALTTGKGDPRFAKKK